jgi:hypothetical protein
MATETEPTPVVGPGPTIHFGEIPEAMRHMAAELNTYLREMPRLLAEGEQGHYALIQGDQLVNVWDTFRDAMQFGSEKFAGGGWFSAWLIDRREYARLLQRLQSMADEGT